MRIAPEAMLGHVALMNREVETAKESRAVCNRVDRNNRNRKATLSLQFFLSVLALFLFLGEVHFCNFKFHIRLIK